MEIINDIVGKNLKIYQDNDFFKFSLECANSLNFINKNDCENIWSRTSKTRL